MRKHRWRLCSSGPARFQLRRLRKTVACMPGLLRSPMKHPWCIYKPLWVPEGLKQHNTASYSAKMTTLDRQPSNLSRIDDEKNPDEVVEHSGRLSQDGPLESKFAHLNRKQALRVYWKSIMWGLAFCAGVLCDGYAIVCESMRHLVQQI